MARKKKSRVQFMLVRKPLQVRVQAKQSGELPLSPQSFRGGLAMLQSEEHFWTNVLPSPMALAKSRLAVNIISPIFLLWR